MSDQKSQLEEYTVVVADTGDINAIKELKPTDATTNPSLLFAAASMPEYADLMEQALAFARQKGGSLEEQVVHACDKLNVLFGTEILKDVPGFVSTEVNADLSFDVEASIRKAHEFIAMYEEAGVPRERVLIKLASTWEGIRACEVLQKEGIQCNMTLIFNLAQAANAAEAGATLISPFVGRITDWYKASLGVEGFAPEEDPGVKSVQKIYTYFKQQKFPTYVMGASFRNAGQIRELVGCDRLTISPALLNELARTQEPLTRKLDQEAALAAESIPKVPTDEASFRWLLNEDQMATEKLSEGIRKFNADFQKLKDVVRSKLQG